MEQAFGIVDNVEDDLEATRQYPSHKNASLPDRVPVPRRSFSTTGRRTPAASIRSRANSIFTNHDAPLSPQLPNNVDTSQVAVTRDGENDATDANEDDDEYNADKQDRVWNPLHPCWPHPNTHVPQFSPLYKSTRIIRVQRDYRVAGDLYPAFETLYPEILEGNLSQIDFRVLVDTMNSKLKSVFDPFARRNWVDAVASVMSGWILEDIGLTGVKRGVKDLEAWLDRWNQQVGRPNGVLAISLRRTAFLSLDLQVPDPNVGEGVADVAADNECRTNDGTAMSEIESTMGGSQSLRTSGSYSRMGLKAAAPAPIVPPIPREYLAGEQR